MPDEHNKRLLELREVKPVDGDFGGIYVTYPRSVSRSDAWIHLVLYPPFELAASPHNPWRKLHGEAWGWYIPKLKLADQKLISYEEPHGN